MGGRGKQPRLNGCYFIFPIIALWSRLSSGISLRTIILCGEGMFYTTANLARDVAVTAPDTAPRFHFQLDEGIRIHGSKGFLFAWMQLAVMLSVLG